MNTLKIELAVAAAALFALGAFFATRPQGAEATQAAALTFTQKDFDAFDRGFALDGEICEVGIRRQRVCFAGAPMERGLEIGAVLAPDVVIMAAEFRVIVITDLKAEHLQTARFGRTLALVDTRTREVTDLLRLAAPSYAAARANPAP